MVSASVGTVHFSYHIHDSYLTATMKGQYCNDGARIKHNEVNTEEFTLLYALLADMSLLIQSVWLA